MVNTLIRPMVCNLAFTKNDTFTTVLKVDATVRLETISAYFFSNRSIGTCPVGWMWLPHRWYQSCSKGFKKNFLADYY